MIDTGEGSNWKSALEPDNRSLKFYTTEELNAPFVLEAIQRWHGCTIGEAVIKRDEELACRTEVDEHG
jgi:hypothetical protein